MIDRTRADPAASSAVSSFASRTAATMPATTASAPAFGGIGTVGPVGPGGLINVPCPLWSSNSVAGNGHNADRWLLVASTGSR
jgi:hypothetical protein